MAHIGYFYRVFVTHLQWLDDQHFNQLNALCSLLPGPSSSQLGFAIGYSRAGTMGGLAAFVGFTLPSFIFMTITAIGLVSVRDNGDLLQPFVNAMKLFAIVVVADASAGMFSQLCQSFWQRTLVILTTMTLLMGINTLFIIAICGVIGIGFAKPINPPEAPVNIKVNWRFFIIFALILGLCIVWQETLFSRFYIVGSSVFGGGHVVLPMLQQFFAAQFDSQILLSGYALAQAIPGPMFTIASFLGAGLDPYQPLQGALIATVGIFLPGFLLVIALFHHWQAWQKHPTIHKITQGLNAAMVALLLSSLFGYILPTSVYTSGDLILLTIAAVALWKLPKGLLWSAAVILIGQTIY